MLSKIILYYIRSFDDWTAIHYAVTSGHTKIVKYLIQNNANINVLTSSQKSPLHIAVMKGYYKIVQLLLKHDQGLIDLQDSE